MARRALGRASGADRGSAQDPLCQDPEVPAARAPRRRVAAPVETSSASAAHDRRGERHPVVLRPGWAQPSPEVPAGSRRPAPQHGGRLPLDVLRLEEVDVPATGVCELGEHLSVHDRRRPGPRRAPGVGRRCRRGSPPARPAARSRRPGRGSAAASSSSAAEVARATDARTFATSAAVAATSSPCSRSGSAQPSRPLRPAPSAAGRRPRGPPTPSPRSPTQVIRDPHTHAPLYTRPRPAALDLPRPPGTTRPHPAVPSPE